MSWACQSMAARPVCPSSSLLLSRCAAAHPSAFLQHTRMRREHKTREVQATVRTRQGTDRWSATGMRPDANSSARTIAEGHNCYAARGSCQLVQPTGLLACTSCVAPPLASHRESGTEEAERRQRRKTPPGSRHIIRRCPSQQALPYPDKPTAGRRTQHAVCRTPHAARRRVECTARQKRKGVGQHGHSLKKRQKPHKSPTPPQPHKAAA